MPLRACAARRAILTPPPRMRTFRILLVLGHFGPLTHLYRARLLRSEQEWRPPIPWPDLARFGPIYS